MAKAYKCDLCEEYFDKGHNTIRIWGRRYSKSKLWGKRWELCDDCIDNLFGKLRVKND